MLDLTGLVSTYYLGWYIRWILICYVAYYVFALFPGGRKTLYFCFVAFGIGTALLTPGLYAAQSFSFLLGIAFSDHPAFCRKIGEHRLNWLILMFILGCGSLAVKQIPAVRNASQILMNCIEILVAVGFALAFSLVIYCIGQALDNSSRVSYNFVSKLPWPLWALGMISYEMYLTHGYTLWLVKLSAPGAIIFYVLTASTAAGTHIVVKWVQGKVRQVLDIKN